jgi:hypothetical protein
MRAPFFLALWLIRVGAAGTTNAPPVPDVVCTYDARPLREANLALAPEAQRVWDTLHLLAALQGLANREAPQLYLLYCSQFGVETDVFWLDWYRGEDGWLRRAKVVPLANPAAALARFRTTFEGLVVYDPQVPATACLASTAAGCERLLPVRYDPSPDSVFSLCSVRLGLPVRLWLVQPDGTARFTGRGAIPDSTEPTSGSAKIDAYRWARNRWLKPGGCNPRLAAYYLDAFWLDRPRNAPPDNHTLPNHDYFVAQKAFFFDLAPWADEAPVDDPRQTAGLDRGMLLDILGRLYDLSGGAVLKIGGFPPWPFKYTTHGSAGRHEGVPTEWEFTRLISQFNAYKEADAAGLGCIANASFHQHYPLADRYLQPNARPSRRDWQARGFLDSDGRVAPRFFLGHYVGDYDAPSWLYKAVAAHFADPTRGQVPLAWAFDPNLADRAPQALVYAYRHATTNDWFVTGNSGAGYLNPRALTVRPESGRPSGLSAWQAWCEHCYRRWDLTITGFVLDGAAGASTDLEFAAYARFSPDGAGTHFDPGPRLRGRLATCPEKDLPDGAREAADFIARRAGGNQGRPGFLWARSILKPPRWYAEVSRRLRDEHPGAPVEVVDPYTFFGLIAVTESR